MLAECASLYWHFPGCSKLELSWFLYLFILAFQGLNQALSHDRKTLGHPAPLPSALSSFENPHGWLMALIFSSICLVSCWNVSVVLPSSPSIPLWLPGRVVWSWLSTCGLGTQSGYSGNPYSCSMPSLHALSSEEKMAPVYDGRDTPGSISMANNIYWCEYACREMLGRKKIMKTPSSSLKLECSTGDH